MAEADQIGNLRQTESERRHSENRYGASGGQFLHQVGARGECCFAKATGLTWWKGVNRYQDPDVGPFEVRTRSKHGYELIVRLHAKDRPYALLTGTGPYFIVWGWIDGRGAKKAKWLQSYGDRESAYFVPHKALQSINDIRAPFPIEHWTDNWLVDPEEKWERLRATADTQIYDN